MRPARKPLKDWRPVLTKICPTCGQSFPSQRVNALYCSQRCTARAWRYAVKLAGTHDSNGKRR